MQQQDDDAADEIAARRSADLDPDDPETYERAARELQGIADRYPVMAADPELAFMIADGVESIRAVAERKRRQRAALT